MVRNEPRSNAAGVTRKTGPNAPASGKFKFVKPAARKGGGRRGGEGTWVPKNAPAGTEIRKPGARAGQPAVIVTPSGPREKVSLTVPSPTMDGVRERVEPGAVSAYVSAAIQRQLERDNLDDIIAEMESVNGPVSEAAIKAAAAEWP